MTPEQQNKLKAIKAALKQHIEEAEKATPGPWTWKTKYSGSAELDEPRIFLGESSSLPAKQPHLNAAFIACARAMSPLACKMALAGIKALSDRHTFAVSQGWPSPTEEDLLHLLSIWEGGQP